MTGNNYIEARNLSFSYSHPTVEALSDVSFTIGQGSFSGITGPNGSGKTTLINLIMGFLKPASGAIIVMEKNPSSDPLSVRRLIGYVPQREQVNDRMPIKVEDVILQGAIARHGAFLDKRERVERLKRVLEMIDLEGFSDHPFNTLSGGQQQRVLIGRALAVDPVLLVLDEPFAAVDIASQVTIADLLKKLSIENGLTILAVVHNINVLVHHIDSILLLNRKVVAFGKPNEVLRSDYLKEAYGTEVPVLMCDEGYSHPLLEGISHVGH
ncbi:MAG: metal ABC transporter ATP-binding protein [bacterium]